MKNPKLVIGIIVIIVLLIIFFAVLANAKTTTVTKSGEVVTQPSIWDSIIGIVTPKGTSTATGQGESTWCKIFPKTKACRCVNGCDKTKSGYDCDGFPSVDCGFGG